MTSIIDSLRDELRVPLHGPIDFRALLGTSLPEALDRWHRGHVHIPKRTVQRITFDEPSVITAGAHCTPIDQAYLASHGLQFLPYQHTYDWSTGVSGFEPAQGRFIGQDPAMWYEPHVYAVADRSIADNYSLSKPCSINVGDEAFGGPTQLMSNDKAIRINFDVPVCAVQIRCDFRISHEDQGKPIWNWPQMLAYDSSDKLLHQAEAPYGGTLNVSSWAGDIAYVIVTVNNHFAGVEPWGIFDDLVWTKLEFVLLNLKKLRQTPEPVARSALVDQVQHRINELQIAQKRLHKRISKMADLGNRTQLDADITAIMKQTEAFSTFYRKITEDTANRTSANLKET